MPDNPFTLWSTHPYFDPETRAELLALHDDPQEIEDRFSRSLEFGTGGLRGVLGAGTNRMNRYVVRQATAGLAAYISTFGETAHQRGVVIAYDSRHFSREFALEAALTLNANGVVAYLWDSLRPTPMLSFAVRELRAIAGIVITASHNPPRYNGYKVYWEDGGQVPPERADAISACIRAVDDITHVVPMAEGEARQKRLLRDVPGEVDRAYLDRLQPLLTARPEARAACRILYSPLHGTGNIPVRTALAEAGFQVSVVKAQELPDPNFSTVRYPNPEEAEVFTLALTQAEQEHPDIIMATDPDADRLGIFARDRHGRYQLLTGNQIGALLVDHLLRTRAERSDLPANAAVIKTIATSNMVAPICQEYGVALLEVHTGFKFIGDQIREFEETGAHTFLFGFEESYGYLGAPFVRDKDAVMAALLAADAAAAHKAAGRTLYEAMEALWLRCGCFQETLHNVTLTGADGQARITTLMNQLRKAPPAAFGPVAVAYTDDYAAGTGIENATGKTYPLALGKSNVLHYRFADGGFVMVRPSGTEPKLKIYVSVKGANLAEARERLDQVRDSALAQMGLASATPT